MGPSGTSTSSPALPLALRQTILVIYLILTSISRAHSASSQNVQEHDGVEIHPEARMELGPMLGSPGSLLRMRRQSSASVVGNGSMNSQDVPQPPRCLEGQFECQDGHCLPRVFLCDGTPDCRDASDEKGCSGCNDTNYRCGNGECIPKEKKCDGHFDCSSGSDERDNCCNAHEFQCSDGPCIPSAQRCNGNAECSDMSDEYSCNPLADNLTSGAGRVLALPAFRVFWMLILAVALVVLFTPSCN